MASLISSLIDLQDAGEILQKNIEQYNKFFKIFTTNLQDLDLEEFEESSYMLGVKMKRLLKSSSEEFQEVLETIQSQLDLIKEEIEL